MKSSNPDSDNLLAGRPGKDDFLIVGLGASSGGVQALKEFFEHVPASTGMAYVVILHLSPDHDSKLSELLQQVSRIPVIKVTEKTRVEPDHVYVVPPNQHLTMMDEHILVSVNMEVEDRRAPVDIFFRTLASSHGPRAVCVILSGTGANGSMGLKRIKENGGAAFVQNPREAEFNEMPRNAIATDLVDDVMPVAAIPEKIIAYKESLDTVRIPIDTEKRPEAQQHALREIFAQLRTRTGHDFSNYKRPTLLRRIERRINIRNLPDLPSYADYIQLNPEETVALLKDLLISVTNFFRDRKAFDAIERDILPKIIEGKQPEDQLRIWVAGCATGEEAYSLAMLCAEKALGTANMPKVQIFATDIDEAAIAQAREGIYTINDAADVPPERLRRFFVKEGDGYRVRREIREMILFASHNFIKDPPFSHLDLISCRNVLIYLNHSAQERVMETFHFALRPGGFLFLGSSESATGASDLYNIFSREHHIFQSRHLKLHAYPVPESVPSFQFKQPDMPNSTIERAQGNMERITVSELHQRLLEQYAPPSVVVNEEYDIVHLSERAGRYLQITGGEPSQNLLKLIKPELRLELRSAFYQSMQRKMPVEARGLKVTVEERTETINIHVRPVLREDDKARGYILVVFERTADEEAKKEVVLTTDEPIARQLEEELMRVKAQLRASVEQHEFHAEELKASNEELQAMNEELRSAAEELETSKEELQSINEELRTVNQELKVRIEETTLANNNLQNLIKSADIGTIFLDRSLRIALFTPPIRSIFNLIPNDIGRPLSDITHRLSYNNLMADAEYVLDKLLPVEHEIRNADGRLFMMRLLPYRTSEDLINGVVITFFEITERKHAEEALRKSEERYRSLFNSINEAFALCEIIKDANGNTINYHMLEANPAFKKMTGLKQGLDQGQTAWKTVMPGLQQRWLEACAAVAATGEPVYIENYVTAVNRWFEIRFSRIGGPGSVLVAIVINDSTERKRTEANVAFLADIGADFINLTSPEEIMNSIGEKMYQRFGLSRINFSYINEASDLVINIYDKHEPALPGILGNQQLSDFVNDEYGDFLKTSKVYAINDINASRYTAGKAAAFKTLGAEAQLVAPFVSGGKWLFMITLQKSEPYIWRPDEQELLQDLAPRIYLCIERARAGEALRKSESTLATELANMQRLHQVSSQMIVEDKSDLLYQHILDTALAIMQADTGCIQLYIPEKEQLHLLTHKGFDDDTAARWQSVAPDAVHIFGQALAKKERVIIPDINAITSQLGKEEQEAYRHLGARAMQSTPLVTRNGDLVGMISNCWEAPYTPTEKALHILDVLARQAADLMERKFSEQALRDSEERFRAIVSQTTAGICRTTIDGILLFTNQTFLEMLGYDEPEIIGKAIWDLTDEDQETSRQSLRWLMADGKPFETEKRLRRKNGSILWASISVAPMRDHTGMHSSTVAVVLDITRRRALEKQKEDFIGIASHELKTPITSIKAYTEILQEIFQEAQDEQSVELMKKLDVQINHLTDLINMLLDTTKIAEGKLALTPQQFDLNELIAERVEDLQRVSKKHRLILRQEKLQPITADREHINQVLTNLLSNAIKYSPKGGDVIITTAEADGQVSISIQDFGIGIPEILKEKVFDRFFRVQNMQQQTFPGMGLGLYITAGIIKRHGGTIAVESEEGKGTVFTVTLPYKSNII
ncbi:PAS domain S-box-containing protein [Chitinophaga rupis]|uniref:histidine kinase n=1 Tax=Chitinophaga rupis TaxID=573321 RepID=A0A1H7QZ90_9BACT|nr:CheR family methyltransferase [Chitinophaga rupis]SEL53306.1 PAS domain S-box-containing protein [Chitinophaga rupis]